MMLTNRNRISTPLKTSRVFVLCSPVRVRRARRHCRDRRKQLEQDHFCGPNRYVPQTERQMKHTLQGRRDRIVASGELVWHSLPLIPSCILYSPCPPLPLTHPTLSSPPVILSAQPHTYLRSPKSQASQQRSLLQPSRRLLIRGHQSNRLLWRKSPLWEHNRAGPQRSLLGPNRSQAGPWISQWQSNR